MVYNRLLTGPWVLGSLRQWVWNRRFFCLMSLNDLSGATTVLAPSVGSQEKAQCGVCASGAKGKGCSPQEPVRPSSRHRGTLSSFHQQHQDSAAGDGSFIHFYRKSTASRARTRSSCPIYHTDPQGKLWVKVAASVFHSVAPFGLIAGLNVRTKEGNGGLNQNSSWGGRKVIT